MPGLFRRHRVMVGTEHAAFVDLELDRALVEGGHRRHVFDLAGRVKMVEFEGLGRLIPAAH